MRAGPAFTRAVVAAAGLLAAACAGERGGSTGAAATRVVSDSALLALPELRTEDGSLVCTALGADPCPLRSAFANWLGAGRYALWEPGRLVLVADAEYPHGRPIGSIGQDRGRYSTAVAVGPAGSDVVILDAQGRMVRYTDAGKFEDEQGMPEPQPNAAPGYAGATRLLQGVWARQAGGTAHLQVQVLRSARDSVGELVLDEPIPWLQLRDGIQDGATPLFGASPRYAIDADQTLVWSPGDRYEVQRRTFDGKVLWTLSSDRKGAPVTPEDIARRRREVEASGAPEVSMPGRVDSMVALTPTHHPAVAGFIVEPEGRILVAGSASPTLDFVHFVMLTRDGVPTHRLTLPADSRPLLMAGDSLLVHRPVGEAREVRWLKLRGAP